jgi:adenylosuccinate lyase
MRSIWSEIEKRKTWRRVWASIARAQSHFGLVTETELRDIESHIDDIDVNAAEALERELKHDLVAELRTFAAQCKEGGRILHLGATSMDVEDNADIMRIKRSVKIINNSLRHLLKRVAYLVEEHSETPTMGFTHLQPAEPTTIGYRFAQWAQDLLEDTKCLSDFEMNIRGKGIRGATGTSASFLDLLNDEEQVETFERLVLHDLEIEPFPVVTQTYPRKQDLNLVTALAGLGQSLYKMAYDIRILQSPIVGEIHEPFGQKQIGSSAMPFKQNPVSAENIDSLARQLAALPRIAWDNAAHSHLERTLDDSANRRSLLPEAFLLTDAIISRMTKIIDGIKIDVMASRKLLEKYGTFAATEKLLMTAVKNGADRNEFHELLRGHCLDAWKEVNSSGDNRLVFRLCDDTKITKYINPKDIRGLMDASSHVGLAPKKAKEFAFLIRNVIHALEQRAVC